MPNIASVLKDEIARIARKEIRREVGTLRKASAHYRRDIAALKKQVSRLERKAGIMEKNVLAKPVTANVDPDEANLRFSPKGLKTQRDRLGLSAADYAKLAGVSPLSIYNWEKGKTRPRKAQIATLAALRGISKKEAAARLEAM